MRQPIPRALRAAVAVLVTGCVTWRPIDTVPLVLLAPDNPNRPPEIQITTQARGKERLRSPRLSGDTLVGIPGGQREAPARRIPLDSVLAIETQRFSGGATALTLLLTLLIGTATFLTVVLTMMW